MLQQLLGSELSDAARVVARNDVRLRQALARGDTSRIGGGGRAAAEAEAQTRRRRDVEAEVASRRDVSETTAQIDEVLRLSAERVGGGGQARAAAASAARLHREDESLWRDAARHAEESPPPSRSARHAAAVRGGADPGSPVLHPKCFWRDSLSASEEDEEEIDDDDRFWSDDSGSPRCPIAATTTRRCPATTTRCAWRRAGRRGTRGGAASTPTG